MKSKNNSQFSTLHSPLIPPGYKQTEVGVIPEDWAVKDFGNLFAFSGGFSASRDQLSEIGYCYLHYGDIHGTTKTCVDTCHDFQDIPKLDVPLKKISPKSMLKDGDVVFVDASEDDEGTSKHVVVVNNENIPFISGLHTIVAKSKTDELAHEFRRFCFQTAAIRSQFLFYAVGTKVSGISKSNIPKLRLPLPTLPEQHAIATALSDVDALLDGLDRLIAKKRDLKQAAMQQLLTGKTRLPGFEGGWVIKRLGELLLSPPDYGINAPATELTGALPTYLRITDIDDYGNFKKDDRVAVNHPASIHYFLGTNEIVFARTGASVGKTYLYKPEDGEMVFAGFLIRCKIDPSKLNPVFFLNVTFSNEYWNWVSIMSMRSGQPGINGNEYASFEFTIPPTIEEQTAIATVLFDMDAEIAALEQRRAKTKDIKQAMMQELLTGKTRLVSREAAKSAKGEKNGS